MDSSVVEQKVAKTQIKFRSDLGALYGYWLLHICLSFFTLGIYSFWGRTNVRRHLAQCISVFNERVEYIGTGKELFFGFLKAIPLFILGYILLFVLSLTPLIALVFIPAIYIYWIASYGSMKYRFSRLTWCGIRGHLSGSSFTYANLSFWRAFLDVITFGILISHTDIEKWRFTIKHSAIGDTKLKFHGENDALFGTHIITGILAIFTLGISRFWYMAALKRYQLEHTTFQNIQLKSTITGGSLWWLMTSNLCILIFTLGLGRPIVINRNFRFYTEHTHIVGELDGSKILQSKELPSKTGEGLESILDLDTGIL